MKHLLFALLLAPGLCSAQTIDWSWLNTPCAIMLNCDSGCTACNVPANSEATLIGNNLGRQGIDICPQPAVPGDNVLLSYGWTALPDDAHSVFLTAIAFTPVHIDSIIVRHRSGADGPQRLAIKYGTNGSNELSTLSDDFTPSSFSSTVFTDLGCLTANEGMAYALFELRFEAYQGGGGSWDLDQVRVVATPCSQTGITELDHTVPDASRVRFDVLGRPVGHNAAPGVYGDQRRWVVVDRD